MIKLPTEKFSVTDTTRATEWWEFKLSPMLATLYATAVLSNVPLNKIWTFLLLLIVALAVGAAYVSIINDLTDVEIDRICGKRNRLACKSLPYKATVLLCCLLPGLAITIYLARFDLLSCVLYLGAWIAYTLYSVPPFRFKNRGILGVMSDAGGAHFFPQLFIVSAASAWVGQNVNWKWFIATGVWSLACGIRGILWHQVSDVSNDMRAGLNTFVCKRSKAFACWLGERIVFPIELLAFVAMIFLTRNLFAAIFLVLYFTIVWSRSVVWEVNMVIVAPQPKSHIFMNEYYIVFYPLAFLLVSAYRSPFDIVFLIFHFMLFPRHAAQCIKDMFRLIVDGAAINKNYRANN